ncbi:(S)-N-methylcoclaurine 3'-hydroxylase isozyme 1 (Fragment) [Linum grandiflorum]
MFIYLLLIFLLPLTIFLFTTTAKPQPPSPPLPPGPKPWPIIGNLLQLTNKPHISLNSFSKLYGPLISLRLGSQLLVVASSPSAAAEILRTHDRLLSARFVPRVVPSSISELDRKAIIWASNCHENWKTFRTILKTQLVSAKAVETHASIREQKAAEMVNFVRTKKLGEEVNISEVVFGTIMDSLSNLVFSRNCIGFEETATAAKLKSLVWRLMELGAAPNLADFFPFLEKLDPQGLRREAGRTITEFFSIWKPYVKERRELCRQRRGNDGGDFLDVFLENELDDDQIDWLNLELFVAGTETNTTVVEWAMTELMKNRRAMDKLRDELKREFFSNDQKPLLEEANVYQLPYLTAVIKETFRLHPPAPLLVPHRSPETLQVMNYTIPERARITVNVWAIGRDCSIWGDDAASFKPERFLGSNIDFQGQDFELLPFSAGRRMCPGMPLAARQIPLLLANLVWNFDWCLPNGEQPSELDMEEKFGITLQKKRPLILVPRPTRSLSE